VPAHEQRAARSAQDRRCSSATTTTATSMAREQLVDRFLPLARQLARRYQRGGEPLDDLVQVASLGLLKAIDRFDPAARPRSRRSPCRRSWASSSAISATRGGRSASRAISRSSP
jgi:RNA polymerase sigma factor (sigma-70 family)